MPETETIELRTDTVEVLIDRLDYEIVGRRGRMSRARRNAVIDRLKKQTQKPDAIGLCGLPGAGKSKVATKLAEVYDTSVVSMGDAIRQQYKEQHPRGKMDSKHLGEFASQWRDDDPIAIPDKVAEIAMENDDDLVIIDGVRSVTDYNVLEDRFDSLHLIEVQADFYTRLDRLQDRGREGEDGFTGIDLAKRDDRELFELGFYKTREDDLIDIELENRKDLAELTINVSDVVENDLHFDIENGKPLGLDDDLEKIRKSMSA